MNFRCYLLRKLESVFVELVELIFVNILLHFLIKQFSYHFIDAVLLDFFFNGQEVRERIFKGSSGTIGIVYKTQVFNK